jgi:glycosyltransferase involved in cell wall biosynthesis
MESTESLATTIAIPTYNGRNRVVEVLEALAKQDASSNSFEVVVVDNNSTDGTPDTVRNHPSWGALQRRAVRCQIVSETRQGLTFGRICGVQAARGRYVCFLDDDTVPDESYVRSGAAAFADDPKIGLLVSRLRPRYAAPITPAMERREHLFAINRRLGDQRIDFGAIPTMAPTLGGGLWVRRSAFLSVVPWATPGAMLPDRIGNRLVSGNDIEIGFLLGRAGYRRLYCPELSLEHRIPAGRLQTRYFARLISGIVRSTITLDHRYGIRRYTTKDRVAAAARLGSAIVASPVLLTREDGFRECLFVFASRWATLRGPFGSPGD